MEGQILQRKVVCCDLRKGRGTRSRHKQQMAMTEAFSMMVHSSKTIWHLFFQIDFDNHLLKKINVPTLAYSFGQNSTKHFT